jgi:hypothetical protein
MFTSELEVRGKASCPLVRNWSEKTSSGVYCVTHGSRAPDPGHATRREQHIPGGHIQCIHDAEVSCQPFEVSRHLKAQMSLVTANRPDSDDTRNTRIGFNVVDLNVVDLKF